MSSEQIQEQREAGRESIEALPVVAEVRAAVAERDVAEGSDALVIEGEVIGVCLTALSRLHPSRRTKVLDYLRERLEGRDYLSLMTSLITDTVKMVDDARAEAKNLRRQLAAPIVVVPKAPAPPPTEEAIATRWRCPCGCLNVGNAVCTACKKPR